MHLKNKGFKGGVAKAASNLLQRAAGKKGFKRFKVVDYQSFVTKAGELFFAPVQAPTQVLLFGRPVWMQFPVPCFLRPSPNIRC